MEHTVVPPVAKADFGMVSKSAALSFLISFGLVKAVAILSVLPQQGERLVMETTTGSST